MGKWAEASQDKQFLRKFHSLFGEVSEKVKKEHPGEELSFEAFVEAFDEKDRFTRRLFEFLVKETFARRRAVNAARASVHASNRSRPPTASTAQPTTAARRVTAAATRPGSRYSVFAPWMPDDGWSVGGAGLGTGEVADDDDDDDDGAVGGDSAAATAEVPHYSSHAGHTSARAAAAAATTSDDDRAGLGAVTALRVLISSSGGGGRLVDRLSQDLQALYGMDAVFTRADRRRVTRTTTTSTTGAATAASALPPRPAPATAPPVAVATVEAPRMQPGGASSAPSPRSVSAADPAPP